MKQKLKPCECLALKFLANKSNKYKLLVPNTKTKINALRYLTDHLYIYLNQNELNNRCFPFDLKQFGFINNTNEIIPDYNIKPPNTYFCIDKDSTDYFFTGFYKISETNKQYVIQMDFIYTASEISNEFDSTYITPTPGQNDTSQKIYMYYNSGNYDGIASVIRSGSFPPYVQGSPLKFYYFVRRNGILPKNRMDTLTGYQINADGNTIIFNNETCDIIRLKVTYSWNDDHSEGNPSIGEIVFTTKIEISK